MLPSPRNGKNCRRNLMLFCNALFYPAILKNLLKNQVFYGIVIKIFKSFRSSCVFYLNARKINGWFLNLFKNCQNNTFFKFSLECFANILKFSGFRMATEILSCHYLTKINFYALNSFSI